MNAFNTKTWVGRGGFTLLEMLIVVGILSLLALVVFVAIDPITQFADSRNARRWSDLNNLSTAIYRYVITNDSFPPGLSETEQQLGTATSGCDSACPGAASSCLNISSAIQPFLNTLPQDPSSGTAAQTGYSIVRNSDNVVTVRACNAENDVTITISR